MANGENSRALEALVRSPVPLEANESALVRDAWRTHVDRRDPKKSAELRAALDNHAWADTVIQAAAQYATRLSGLSPAEIAEAAGPDGRHLFDSSTAAATAA
jgi:hypothetical protein